MHRRRCQ